MKKQSRFADIAILAGILLFVALVYSRIPGASYCGFDDFLEQHRLEGSLAKPLISDFTVQYYEGYKYRPLLWVTNRITYEWGSGSPVAFRTRNVAFHLANLVLLYSIAMLLFHSRMVAAAAALLCGVHPLVNQSVVGAMWTIVECAFLLLSSLLLFLLSVRQKRRWFLLLALSLFCGWLGILSYEACISIFGLIYGYLGIRLLFARTPPVDRRFAVALVALTVLSLGLYFGLRAMYLQPGRPHPFGLAPIVKNFAIYAASPLFLIDPVMANQWLDTPLPSEVARGHITGAWIALTAAPLGCLLVALSIFHKRIVARLKRMEWPELTFLLLAIPISLSPFLLFNSHASETYLYVPMALFVLFMSRTLCALLVEDGGPNWKFNYGVVMGVLLILYGSATWVRNERVVECGSAARQLLTSFPPELNQGAWRIALAAAAGEPASRPYGMYGYRGVHTLGFGDYGAEAVQLAIQHACHNGQLTVAVVTPAELIAIGASPGDRERCFWVHWDGRLTRFGNTYE
jgi:hypothetical protein